MSRNISYKLKYSEFLRNELDRLKNGDDAEVQRFRKIETATARVLCNPLAHAFKKDLPDDYKAVDVLQQYRLFFKITNVDDKNCVIFFTWINDENSLHVNGDINDTYNVFKKLLTKGEIETYCHEELETSKYYFKIHNNWGDNYIYCDLILKLNNDNLYAHSNLIISKTSDNEYRLMPITVTQPNRGLATKIIKYICVEAKNHNYILYFELDTSQTDVDKSRYVLQKCGFAIDNLNSYSDEIEIWIAR